MLRVTADDTDITDVEADVLVVPTFKAQISGPGAGPVLAAIGLDAVPTTPAYRGDIGQTLLLAAPGLDASAVCLVGLGRMDATTPAQLRRAATSAAIAVRGYTTAATTLALAAPGADGFAAVAEGFVLGAHRDDRHRSSARAPEPVALTDVVVCAPSSRLNEATAALHTARIVAEAQLTARELVATPPDHATPARLAEVMADLAGPTCAVRVHDGAALAELGYGATAAVGGGAAEGPRLVELRYTPESPIGHVVLVGKGITFDTGGISLKKPLQMQDMHSDMAGAAAVVATCAALADLDVRVAVTGLCVLAENAISEGAYRPGDVVTARGGTTIEVEDTDAEGRLCLADALAHAAELDADAVVDLATLTGSQISALGWYCAAAMGTDRDLLASLHDAADAAGEALAELPLLADLDHFLDSAIADVRNVADAGPGPGGGAITAGLFLRRFAGDVPWAHIDIAGPSFIPRELARPWLPQGATGYGVRTLLTWLQRGAS